MIIGLTGVFGSGKSEVARIFESLGAQIVSADDIGRAIVNDDPVTMYRLIMAFGRSILTTSQRIDRQILARLAFESKETTSRLNQIVHPTLLQELDRRLDAHCNSRGVLVVDAALLVYWGFHKKMDLTIVVTSPIIIRQRRLLAKGFSKVEIRSRTRAQMSEEVLKAHAEIIIENRGSLQELQVKAREIYLRLTKND